MTVTFNTKDKNAKTVLVTGGTGFLGSHLCERLLARGDAVICLDNNSTGSLDNVRGLMGHRRFRFIHQDVVEPLPVVAGVDEIYNLACPASPARALSGRSGADDPDLRCRRAERARSRPAPRRQGPAGLDQRSLRRAGGPPAVRAVLGQRQSDRVTILLRRGQALRRVLVLRFGLRSRERRYGDGATAPSPTTCVELVATEARPERLTGLRLLSGERLGLSGETGADGAAGPHPAARAGVEP